MSVKRACALSVVACLLAVVSPHPAWALEGRILLGFGAQYSTAEDGSATHRGIDVEMSEGSEVDSPIPGTVRFAGRVPGPGGLSVWCVSVEGEQGVVSLLPLEDVRVSKGDRLDAGDVVATVSRQGDPSSPEAHLHVGLKRSDVYLDPSALLTIPAMRVEPERPEPAPVTQAVQSPAESPLPAQSASPAPVSSPAVGSAAAPQAIPAGDGAVAVPQQAIGAPIDVGEVAVAGQPGVTVPSVTPTAGRALPTGFALEAPAGMPAQAVSAGEAPGPAWAPLSWRSVGAPACAVLAAACASAFMIVTRRSLVRRVTATGPVSDRLGILLQHLKAGDTLCGLTSCSGPLPSQSRGH